MFAQKLILIGLILFEFTVEKCSVQRLIANHTLASNSSKIDKSLNGSSVVNGSNVVNVSSIRNESTTRTVHRKPNKIPPRLQEQDESDDNEDYQDNEGIDGLDEEGAGQEEGDGDEGGGDDDSGGDEGDEGGGDEGGGDDSGADEPEGGGDEGGDGGDEPADEPDDGVQGTEAPGGDGGGGGGDQPAPPDGGGGDGGGQPPDGGGGDQPGGGGQCPADTIFSTANAWRVRLLSQICQLSNYLLHNFHFQYKFIIKKLQHLIKLLSYNQSNMNLEEMVRFLTNIQSTYNQLLSGYVGVFYILKKCQYKNMCFDCAIVTGHLAKLMMETNYTYKPGDLSEIHLSNRTLNYLKSIKIKQANKKLAHKNHAKAGGKTRKSLNKFIAQATSNHLNETTAGQANLTQLLSINRRLHKAFNKLVRLDRSELKRKSIKLAFKKRDRKKVKMKHEEGRNLTKIEDSKMEDSKNGRRAGDDKNLTKVEDGKNRTNLEDSKNRMNLEHTMKFEHSNVTKSPQV